MSLVHWWYQTTLPWIHNGHTLFWMQSYGYLHPLSKLAYIHILSWSLRIPWLLSFGQIGHQFWVEGIYSLLPICSTTFSQWTTLVFHPSWQIVPVCPMGTHLILYTSCLITLATIFWVLLTLGISYDKVHWILAFYIATISMVKSISLFGGKLGNSSRNTSTYSYSTV